MSLAFSLARVEGAILGPIEGWLIDKLGNRRMILIGYLVMTVGFLMFSRVNSLWQFYAAFMVISLGSGLGGWLAMISLVNNWFVRRRSLAIATAMSGIHFGGFLLFLLAYGVDHHGFRWTTLGIGIFLLAVVGPVFKAVKNRPEDVGLLPDGDGGPTSMQPNQPDPGGRDAVEPEFTVLQALKTSAFWALTVVHLSSSISIVTLSIHLAPKLTDMGLSLSEAAVIPAAYTLVALPSQFLAGFIADRFSKPKVIFVFLVFQAAGIMVIAFAESTAMAFLFAVLYGVGFGGRIPLLTAIRGEYFGRRAFATIMGISQMPNSIVMIFAPLYAGYLYDTQQSYFIPFATFGILAFMGAALMLTVRKPSLADSPTPDPSKAAAD